MEVSFDVPLASWDAFVRTSPQRSAYVSSAFLRSLGRPFELAMVRDSGRIVAAAPLILDEEGKALPGPVPMTMYQGLLLADNATMPAHRRIPYELEATQRLVEAIALRHATFCLASSWRLRDIRALSWHNYHAPEKGQLAIQVLYTGILSLRGKSFDEHLAGMRELRRREHKKARGRVTIVDSDDVDLLESLYTKTLARQGVERAPSDRELLAQIAAGAVSGGYGRLRVAMLDGVPASAILFLYDDRTAFYLLGANDPEMRNSGASTYLMLDTIRDAHERGLAEVDFIGVNSPQRGDYKVSFNAEVEPFYIARLKR